jgi:hypothetical protein
LGQAQERQSRLGLAPESRGLPVGSLGLVEVTLQAMDLSALVGGVAEGPLIQHSLGEAPAQPAEFFERDTPSTPERHELSTMHQAETVVRHHVGLLIAPPRQGGSPLSGAAQLVDALTERDRVAIDDPGDDGRQLPGGDGHHRLVHEPQPVLPATPSDQRVALLHQSQRDQVLVTEALADLGDLDCGRVGGLVITAEYVLEQGR